MIDLFPSTNAESEDGVARQPIESDPRRTQKPIASYDYVNEHGVLIFQVLKYQEAPRFRQRRPSHKEPPASQWTWDVHGVERIPYRLPEVAAAIKFGHRIYVCEGEKDADAVAKLNLPATTNVGGAGNWPKECTTALAGAKAVTILADNDSAGIKHARQVRDALLGKVGRVRILQLPDLPPKGDVSDWIAAGGTGEQLEELADSGPTSRGWSDAADMLSDGVPSVDWIIPGLISVPSLAMISGDADTFKSWSMTQLCLSASCPEKMKPRWLGHFPISADRAMLVTADEDRAETLRKIGWLAKGMELTYDTFRGRFLVWCDDLSFDDEATFAKLLEDVEDFSPDLIVIDHLRVCFEDDENSSEFARKVKLRGRAIHRIHPCAVIWIHHVRKIAKEKDLNAARQRVRGTSGLVQSFDHHLAFERDDLGIGTIIVDRNKKGRPVAPFCFDPRIVDSEGMAYLEYTGDAKLAAGSSEEPGQVLKVIRSEARPWKTTEIETVLNRISKRTIQRAYTILEGQRLITIDGNGKGRTYIARETSEWTRHDTKLFAPLRQIRDMGRIPFGDKD